MKCANFLCYLMVVLAFNELQGVQSQGVEITDELRPKLTEISSKETPKNVEFAKDKLARLILKRIKLKLTKVARVQKLRSAPKPRHYRRPKMKNLGKSSAGIAAGVALQQRNNHFYDRFALGYTPRAVPATTTNEEEELQPPLVHYPQLAPFMIPPAYAYNPAMMYPYVPQPQAGYYPRQGFPSPGYQNPVQGIQSQNLEKPAEDDEEDFEKRTESQV